MNEGMKEDGGGRGDGGGGGGLGGGRVVVFEMIRPICASFPPMHPPPLGHARSGKPARIPHHRKQRGSPVECHISR